MSSRVVAISVMGVSAARWAAEVARAGHAEHRRAHREPGVAPAAELVGVEPVGVAAHDRLHGGVGGARGLHDGAAVRARPPDGLHPGGERLLPAAEPGTALAEVRVEDADEVEVERAEVPDELRPAHEDLPVARLHGHGRAAAPAPRPGTRPTPRRARRRPGGSRSWWRRTVAHRPGDSHTTHRTSPSSRRRAPPHAAQAAGDAARPADLRDAVPGQRRVQEPALRPRAGPGPGAGPGPPARGFTTSTGGQRRVAGATCRSPRAAASDEGHRADSTHTAPAIRARSKATSRTW